MELAFLPATEQARLVREREVTPLELVELYLERIERLDPELGAFVTVCSDEALADARAKTDAPGERLPRRPDLAQGSRHDCGIRTTFSCPRSRQRPRLRPAHVARLRAAGS
jgi:Asp-tRNA(Asn)/Glu-tRNA(Gln) amidotransferase A subunit family amidase